MLGATSMICRKWSDGSARIESIKCLRWEQDVICSDEAGVVGVRWLVHSAEMAFSPLAHVHLHETGPACFVSPHVRPNSAATGLKRIVLREPNPSLSIMSA